MRKKTSVIVGLCGMLACSLGGLAAQTPKVTQAEAQMRSVYDLFMPSDITIQNAYELENGGLAAAGLLLSSSSKDAKIQMKDEISGDFSLLCAPMFKDGRATLKTLEITFADVETEEDFTLVIDFGTTTSLSVVVDEKRVGLMYLNGSLYGWTEVENAQGKYTDYSKTTVPIEFNADDMSVWVGEDDAKKLIWDFSETENDGCDIGVKLTPFTKYKVSYQIKEYIGASSGVVLYNINGYSLDKLVLHEEGVGEPRLDSKITAYGVIGREYLLPDCFAYDVADGQIEEISAEVFAPNGNKVEIENNAFVPSVAGQYQICYKAKNTFGVSAEKTYTVEILSSIPEYTYAFEKEVNFPETATVGSTVYVPEAVISGGLLIGESQTAKVTVKRDGWTLAYYGNKDSGFTYQFKNSGVYTFTYNLLNQTLVYEVVIAKTDANIYLDYAFEDAYELGAYIDVSNAKLFVDGVETEYDAVVTYPNGNSYNNKQFICSESGVYVLTLTSKTNAAHSVSYKLTTAKKVQHNFSSDSKYMEFGYGQSAFTKKSGVEITSPVYGAVAKYNSIIDLSKYTNQTKSVGKQVFGETKTVLADDAIPFIELSAQPYSYETEATDMILVTLTDVYDENNSIQIKIRYEDSKTWSYVRARAGNQGFVGVNYDKVNSTGAVLKMESAGAKYTYGSIVKHTFRGPYSTATSFFGDLRNSQVSLFYDDVEKQILLNNTPYSNQYAIVADFDNPQMCDGALWDGFTTGEVYLSIEFGTLFHSEMGCVVYSVDGVTFESEELAYNKPQIHFDGTQTQGLKGASFEIPKASAYASDGGKIQNVRTQVLYQAANGKEYNVNVKNGWFDTPYAGTYIIRYYATDAFGNTAMEELCVTVNDSYADFTSVADISDSYKTGKTGQKISLFPVQDIRLDGALGKVNVQTAVMVDGQAVEIIDNSFTPSYAKAYTVTYTLTDGVGRTTEVSYTVNVALETELLIVSSIPQYVGFIEGNTYLLHDVWVVDYSSGDATPKKAEVYVNGEKIENGEYTPDVSATEAETAQEVYRYVTLEYKYGDKVLEGLTYTLPVRNVYKEKTIMIGSNAIPSKAYKADRYFLAGDGVEVGITNAVVLTASKNGGVTQFIEGLVAEGLQLSFDITGKNTATYAPVDTNVAAVHIYITDALDKTKTLVLTVRNESEGTVSALYINGQLASTAISGKLNGTSKDSFGFTLKNGSVYDTKKNTAVSYLQTYANGEAFEGFSEKVFVAFEIERTNAEKSATIQVLNLNGQNFSANFSNDDVAPTLTLDKKLQKLYTKQDTLTVPTASANDVLSSIKEIVVTVEYLSENGYVTVKDVNGLLLNKVPANVEYTLVLDRVGEYRVHYEARDCRAGYAETLRTIQVAANEKPVITLSENVQKQAKVGETVTLPNFSVEFAIEHADNVSYVVYISPDDRYQYLEGNSFRVEKEGVYTIRYFALDYAGNYVIESYEIVVTK